ncbi:hypothetical protein A2930_04050 [Candidatus Giovannonibacteria bacterium RIFCSPLOWO2_01_FULL_45_34]|uniref:Uncharacterized protein n=1 Tax=Candidatus Giovannonibacteria bacterium RIFCSPLOWO2_01_FULL_45_34 TaxID=1798351 RepID=A0A1F5X1H6_9BACT|nr:MAG: hypothetical protein A2930_04050 [Candidatus Giovannonibacteria bacterium RIFCSPLOWO2_01_FULL_45_34]
MCFEKWRVPAWVHPFEKEKARSGLLSKCRNFYLCNKTSNMRNKASVMVQQTISGATGLNSIL